MKPFDSRGEFHPIDQGDGLRRVAVRGAGMSILAAGVSFLVQMVATVVLARLLTPNDFGVVTMVTTFSLLFCSFGLNGFSEVILQREGVTHSLASNLFWINIGAGFLLSMMFVCLGPLLAYFYHDPLVKIVTQGMSLTIIAGSLSVVHLALLNRATRFTVVASNTVVGNTVAVIVSIALAMAGWGYRALVAGYVAQRISISVGAWILCRWIPGVPRRVSGTVAAIKFAMNVYSRFSFNYFTGNTDNLLVGWRFGASALGFYKKAFDLFYLPANQLMSPMNAVAIATLSRLRNDRAYYERYLLAGISCLAFVGMGIGADFTVAGQDMIQFILGPAWTESGRIFIFFGPGIGVMLCYSTHGWIHLSIGRPDRWFRWAVIEFLWTVGLFVIALPLGPKGVALAWTASYFTLMLPAFRYAGKPIGFGVKPVLSVIWRFFVASLLAGGCVEWLIHVTPIFGTMAGARGAFARLVADSLLFFVLYLSAVIALHRGPAPILQTVRLILELLPERYSRQRVETEQAIPAEG